MHCDFGWLLDAYSHPTVAFDLGLRCLGLGGVFPAGNFFSAIDAAMI
jgi:hypothetical protein